MFHKLIKVSYLSFLVFSSFHSIVKTDDEQNKDLAIHYFMQGEFLFNQGNYALAVLEFQDALDIDPNAKLPSDKRIELYIL